MTDKKIKDECGRAILNGDADRLEDLLICNPDLKDAKVSVGFSNSEPLLIQAMQLLTLAMYKEKSYPNHHEHTHAFINGIFPIIANKCEMALAAGPRISTSKNYIGIIKCLLDHGVNPNCWSSESDTPLRLAAKLNHVDVIQLLLKKNAKFTAKYNPIFHAIIANAVEAVDMLSSRGVDLFYQEDNETMLLVSSVLAGKEINQKLVDAGVAIDHCDASGDSPLMCAASSNNLAAFKVLLTANPSLDIVNKDRNTVFTLVQDKPDFALVLKEHLDLNIQNRPEKSQSGCRCM